MPFVGITSRSEKPKRSLLLSKFLHQQLSYQTSSSASNELVAYCVYISRLAPTVV